MLVRKDDFDTSKMSLQTLPINNHNIPAYSAIASFDPLKLKPIRC